MKKSFLIFGFASLALAMLPCASNSYASGGDTTMARRFDPRFMARGVSSKFVTPPYIQGRIPRRDMYTTAPGRRPRTPLDTNFWVQTNGPNGGDIKALAVDSKGHIFAGTDSGVYVRRITALTGQKLV